MFPLLANKTSQHRILVHVNIAWLADWHFGLRRVKAEVTRAESNSQRPALPAAISLF